MFWWLKSLKYASKNNYNGEKLKNKPKKFELIEKHFSQFL